MFFILEIKDTRVGDSERWIAAEGMFGDAVELEQVCGKMNVTLSEAQRQVSETSESTVNSDLR